MFILGSNLFVFLSFAFWALLNVSCTCGLGLLDLCTCINAMRTLAIIF